MAAFFVSLAKAAMKIPQSEFVSAFHLAILGLALTCFGAFSLWAVYARGRRGSTRLLVATVILSLVPALWVARSYSSIMVPAQERFAQLEVNPLGMLLPHVRSGRIPAEEGLVLVLTSDRAVVGRAGAFPLDLDDATSAPGGKLPRKVNSPDELNAAAIDLKASIDAENALLGREDWVSASISADRCLSFERYHSYGSAVQAANIRGMLNVVRTDDAAALFMPLRDWESSGEPGWEDPVFVFELSRQGVQMLVDGEAVPAVEGCSPDGPTLCVGAASDSCEPGWSYARLTELVVSSLGQRDETLYLLRVQPDVPLQHVVSLVDAVAYDIVDGSTDPDWEEPLLVDPLLDLAP